MKTKHIALMIILISSMTPANSSGMSYIRNWYNSLTSKTSDNMPTTTTNTPSSPNWAQRFITRCRRVGILPTFSAMFGVYNFKTMSGLEYDTLDSYDADRLKDAQDLVAERIKDLGHSQKLEDYFMLLQRKYLAALNKEENVATEKAMSKALNQ